MFRTISTSMWINFKNLRFFLLQYLMLVIIFPVSYLLISLTSAGSVMERGTYSTGLFTSMLISLFINMEASMIAQSSSVTAFEQYAVFRVRPLFVHMGGCLYHASLSLPFLALLIILNLVTGRGVDVLLLLISLPACVLFLSALSMVLGGLFRNPNIASPVINMIYMIIVMITPFYGDYGKEGGVMRLLYSLNPFAHVVSLIAGSFGKEMLTKPFVSAGVLVSLAAVLFLPAIKRWYRSTAPEKIDIF